MRKAENGKRDRGVCVRLSELFLSQSQFSLGFFQKYEVDDLVDRDWPSHFGIFPHEIDEHLNGVGLYETILRDHPHNLSERLSGHRWTDRLHLFHDNVQHLILILFVPNEHQPAQCRADHFEDLFRIFPDFFL
jgi:hypothetical protein